ncbi:MAG: DUF3298 domain-containing protein [Neisseriaceae bacterium]|nr:DUF3298 domain-containing protein [Neisseriaceae bacterium]
MQKPQKKAIQKVNVIGSVLSAVVAGTIVFVAMNNQLKQCVIEKNHLKTAVSVPVEKPKNTPDFVPALQPKNQDIFNQTACYHILNATLPNRCVNIHYQTLDTQIDWLNHLLLDNRNIEQVKTDLQQQLEKQHSDNIGFIANNQQIEPTKINIQTPQNKDIENIPVAENNHSVIFLNQKGKIAQFQIHDSEYAFGMAHGIFSTKYRVFDLKNQKEITFDDLILSSKRTILAKILRDRLNENPNLGDEYLLNHCENKEECIEEELLKAQFYFDKDGIIFSYDPYQVAPYSQGVVELKPEYWELQGIIRGDYLPYR